MNKYSLVVPFVSTEDGKRQPAGTRDQQDVNKKTVDERFDNRVQFRLLAFGAKRIDNSRGNKTRKEDQ
jgi:hypothetical protein